MKRLKRNLDLILAGIVALGSSTGAWLAYANILKLEAPQYLLSQPIFLGEHTFSLRSASGCVGEVTTALEHKDTFILTSQGKLRLIVGQSNEESNFITKAVFNPLGQLTSSVTHFTGPGIKMSVSTENVNPISISLKAQLLDKALERVITLPGPVVMKKMSSDSYTLTYAQLSGHSHTLAAPLVSNLKQTLALKLVPKETDTSCKNVRLDLNHVLRSIEQPLRNWVALSNLLMPKEQP